MYFPHSFRQLNVQLKVGGIHQVDYLYFIIPFFMKCYIVDDEKHNIIMITQFIRQTNGLELLGAQTNPLTALEEINLLKPDVVFTDINMPEMDGITLAGLIENRSKIVFVSGNLQTSFLDVDSSHLIHP